MTDQPPVEVLSVDTVGLARWISEHLGTDVDSVDVLRTDSSGFDSDIHFVSVRGASLPAPWRDDLVLRVKGAAGALDDARREAALHDWLADRGYPVPRILAVVDPGVVGAGPAQVLEVAAGVSMLDAAKRRPWRVVDLLDRFAALHNRLHLLAVDDCPTSEDVVVRRLRLPRRVAEELDHDALREAVAHIESLADRMADAPVSLCHGDFHPLNALVDGDDIAVIDWTDGGLGDRHCDVARTVALFDIASIVAGSPLERRALDVVGPRLGAAYRRRYDAGLAIDPDRLALWTPIHLLHDWSQALAGSARASTMPATMATALRERFERALDAVPST